MLFYEEKIKKYSDELYICTDDGTKGYKGSVIDLLKLIINDNKYKNKTIRIVAIGPILMMKKCVDLVFPLDNVEILVSINSTMVDGIGMCGSCRVYVENKIHFCCIDGPEFNGKYIDFESIK